MKNPFLLATLAASLLLGSPPARAQLDIAVSTVDPLTKLPPEKWIYLATHIVNASPIVGKDSVYAVNATGETLAAVTCRGYFLAGPSPYITNNKTTAAPASLPAWSVTLIPSESFDAYCKAGVDAQGTGAVYHGVLNSADHTFGAATFVVFWKPAQ